MTMTTRVGQAPGALPLLGHALPLLRDPARFLASLPAHGDLVHVRLGPVTALTVCDPDLTRQVLLDDRTFDKGGPAFDRFREVAGNGLGSCRHAAHRRQRRLLQPAFHPARLPGYAQVMAEHIDAVTHSWCEGQTLDVSTEMQKITAKALLAAMFADALPAVSFADLLEDLNQITQGLFRRMLIPSWMNVLPTPGKIRYHRAHVRLRRTTMGVIANRRTDQIDHHDLLWMLLTSADPPTSVSGQAQRLTDEEISEQLMTFFFAGVETAAATLAWSLHLLAQHPDVERRLHAETDRVLAGRAATFEDVPKLPYTGRIITEALRLYPPGWILTRITTSDTHLGTHPVSAGTTIIYSPYLIHHRPDLYDDPDRFDPDRWSNSHQAHPTNSAFVPFGGGARKCIGDQFGIIETVIALATIAARWRLQPLSGSSVRPALAATLSPKRLRMRVKARSVLRQEQAVS